jgi:hypothetical protein
VERAVRAAETEAIFRDVNETMAEQEGGVSSDERVSLLCECSNDACADSVRVPKAEYERVRAQSDQFLIKPGHVTEGIELVLQRHPEHWVIAKVGVAREIAEETDPRL